MMTSPSIEINNVGEPGKREFLRLPVFPQEIWALVGQQLHNKRSLVVLVQVCRSFLSIFGPLLHASLVINIDKIITWQVEEVPLPLGTEDAKDLEMFTTDKSLPINHNITIFGCGVISAFITQRIKAMPKLSSFRWYDEGELKFNAGIVFRLGILAALASKKIEHLFVHLSRTGHRSQKLRPNCAFPLAGFNGLTSLELYNLNEVKDVLVTNLVECLVRCPGLKTLGLGMACKWVHTDAPSTPIIHEAHSKEFINERDYLEVICMRFGQEIEQKGLSPLFLRTLRLGVAVGPYPPTSQGVNNYLEKLTSPDTLRTLHIFNGSWLQKIYAPTHHNLCPMETDIDFSLFERCNSLDQLHVSKLSPDVLEWLNTGGNSVREIALSEVVDEQRLNAENINLLKLPSLRMFFVQDQWDQIPDVGEHQRYVVKKTILDRLHDGGVRLKVLGMSLDFDAQWSHFSQQLLTLTSLTYLRLFRGGRWQTEAMPQGRFPNRADSLWQGIHDSKTIALRYVRFMKDLCPSLQYVMIGSYLWQIIPRYIPYQKRTEYDYYETSQFDEPHPIFAYDIGPFQSGLRGSFGPLRKCHSYTDEDWDEMS